MTLVYALLASWLLAHPAPARRPAPAPSQVESCLDEDGEECEDCLECEP